MTQDRAPLYQSDKRTRHWRSTRRLTAILLALWALATFGLIFSARSMAHLTVFGWPLPFYMSAQGTLLIYVAIIGFYAWRMRDYDRQYHSKDSDED